MYNSDIHPATPLVIGISSRALFNLEAENAIYETQGLDKYEEYQIAHIQHSFKDMEKPPIRTALVTSRNAPAHERAIKTLRNWNVHVDEAYFLGGVSKKEILSAFGAHIFFDDQRIHADAASEYVASAVVPYKKGEDPRE